MFRFHAERLNPEECLGRGRYGEVFPYQKSPDDLKWVVKRILAKNVDELISCLPEIVLGFACDHPCIVPMKGYFIEKIPNFNYFHIYMKIPRMKETLLSNFKDRKRKGNSFAENEIINYFYSIVHGLYNLHYRKIYHRDIRPDNLLFDDSGNLKIADIGIAKHVEDEDMYQTLTGSVGTYYYSAPEILGERAQKSKLSKADIWSLGVVILELCVFNIRLLNCSLSQDRLQDKLNELFQSLEGKYHNSLINLIRRSLNLDPMKRPDIEQLKSELERTFYHVLDPNLLNLGKVFSIPKERDSEGQISVLNQQIKEISDKFQEGGKQLKEVVTQLELNLFQQKQQYQDKFQTLQSQNEVSARQIPTNEDILQERIKNLEHELEECKRQLQDLRGKDEKLRSLEQEILNLQQEKTSHEQKSKDLEKYINITIKNQMNAYESQIKTLQESQLQEKKHLDQENQKLRIDLKALQSKMLEFDKLNKIESKADNQEAKLKEVTSKLNNQWSQLFTISDNQGILKIHHNGKRWLANDQITDEHICAISKDLSQLLPKNNPLNLTGLEIDYWGCRNLTDKAFIELTQTISNENFHLEHLNLNFVWCGKMTNKAVQILEEKLSNLLAHLVHLSLNFSKCGQLTDPAIETLARIISDKSLYLKDLNLEFSG